MDKAVEYSQNGYRKHDATNLRDRAKHLAPHATAIWDIQLPHEIPE